MFFFIISFLFLCLLILLFLSCLIIWKKTQIINNNGFLLFKINTQDKWVVKIDSIKHLSISSFDSGSYAMIQNKFYKISYFLKHFSIDTANKIQNILNLDNNYAQIFQGNLNPDISKSIGLNNYLNFKKIPVSLNISTKNNNIVYLSLSWKINTQVENVQNKLKIININELIAFNNNYIGVISLMPNLEHENNSINKVFYNISKTFNIDIKNTKYIFHDNVYYLIQNFNSKHKLKKFVNQKLKIVKYLNKNNFINPHVLNSILVSSKTIYSQKELIDFHWKCKYLLHNSQKLKINFLDLQKNSIQQNKLNDYKIQFNYFIDKIETNSFIRESSTINILNSNNKINRQIILGKIAGMEQIDIDSFNNISSLSIKYLQNLNQYLIDSTPNNMPIMLHTTDYILYKNIENWKNKNILFIIKPQFNKFNFNLIKQILMNNNENNKIGLYITEINPKIKSFIEQGLINSFVISSKLSKNITKDTEIYLKLYDLMQTISQLKKYKVFWENLPDNIESYYLKKLNIKLTYKNNYI